MTLNDKPSWPQAPAITTDHVLLSGATPQQAAAWSATLSGEGLLVLEAGSIRQDTPVRSVLMCANDDRGHYGMLSPSLPQLRQLRRDWPDAALLALCAAPREVDQIVALELGADGVLAADSSATLVAARLRALWRWRTDVPLASCTPLAPRTLRFGALCIDRDHRRVTLGQVTVALTEGEFEVLWLLASHSGEPLSRRELQARLAGTPSSAARASPDGRSGADEGAIEALEGRGIDSRIYRLRGKLGDRARAAPGIRTVRHRGYVFAPAAW